MADFLNGLGAFARGTGQGASLGFSDEGQAALEALLMQQAMPRAAGQGMNAPVMSPYESNVQTQREMNTAAQTENPNAYLAGDVAGGVATGALLPGAGAGATAAKAIGTTAADVVGRDRDVGGGDVLSILGSMIPAGGAMARGLMGRAGGKAVAAGGDDVLRNVPSPPVHASGTVPMGAPDVHTPFTQSAIPIPEAHSFDSWDDAFKGFEAAGGKKAVGAGVGAAKKKARQDEGIVDRPERHAMSSGARDALERGSARRNNFRQRVHVVDVETGRPIRKATPAELGKGNQRWKLDGREVHLVHEEASKAGR